LHVSLYKGYIEYYQSLINESLKRTIKIEIHSNIMLEYQKCSTHANTDYGYKNRTNIIIYDLTRTKDATKQSAKCTAILVYLYTQNAYN